MLVIDLIPTVKVLFVTYFLFVEFCTIAASCKSHFLSGKSRGNVFLFRVYRNHRLRKIDLRLCLGHYSFFLVYLATADVNDVQKYFYFQSQSNFTSFGFIALG